MISSFILYGNEEVKVKDKKCCIRGCEHKAGDSCDTPASRGIPAYVVWDTDINNYVGVACPHHVSEILGE